MFIVYVLLTGIYCLCCVDRCLLFMFMFVYILVVVTGVYIHVVLSCCDSGLLCLCRYGAWFVGQRAVTRPQVQGRQKSRRIKSTR